MAISQQEYFDLLAVEADQQLNDRISRAFYVAKYATPERYAMLNHDWKGNCPLRGDDGLCMIHSSLGESKLPNVCRLYPRSIRRDISEAALANSCEGVLDILIKRKTQLRFEEVDLGITGEGIERPSRMSLRMQCIGMLQDRNSTLRESFESVGQLITGKRAQNRSFEECLNVLMSFCEEYSDNGSLGVYCSNCLRRLRLMTENEYIKRKEIIDRKFDDFELKKENIIVNHFFVKKFPFVEERENETEEYESLCALFGFLQLLCVGNLENIETQDDLVDLLSKAFRVVEHSAFDYNAHVLLDRAGFGEPDVAGSLLKIGL